MRRARGSAGVRPQATRGVPLTAIGPATRLVGIIGDPVDRSLSPAIHNAAFAALGLDLAYVALPVASRRVGDAVRGLAALGFRGANVTMPHKAAVIPFLDAVDDDAVRAEAVNTIVVDEGRVAGHNTDIGGFRRALHEVVPGGVTGATVLLVGAGGAARAAALALVAGQVSSLRVANRTEEAAQRLVRGLAVVPSAVHVQTLALESLSASDVAGVDVLVNASALGMEGVGKVPAVLTDNIRRGQVVFDVVYKERPTRLLEAAAARGARVVDGRSMLVCQAALAFELWTGREAPLAAMRAAVG